MCLGTCRTSVSHWKSSAFSSGAFHLHHSPKIPTSRLVLFLSLLFFSFPENVRLNFRLHVKQLERNHDKSRGTHWAFLPIILLDSLQLLSSLNTALSYLMLVAWRKRGRDKRRGKKRKKMEEQFVRSDIKMEKQRQLDWKLSLSWARTLCFAKGTDLHKYWFRQFWLSDVYETARKEPEIQEDLLVG